MMRVCVFQAVLVAGAIVAGAAGPAVANDAAHCSVGALQGLYVLSASGFIIPASGSPQPKAIVEVIRFNGDGTLTAPTATRSINGVVATSPPGGTGTYTVDDLVPADGACVGHLTFTNGPSWTFTIPHKADTLSMIQTDSGNVFQGSAVKVAR